MQRETDVVVVGGGLAGLAAATFAARDGARVRLLERAGSHGGRATTQEEQGFLLNVGPHALYNAGAARRILEELGVTWTGRAPGTDGYGYFEGKPHALPAGIRSLLATRLLTFREKVEVARRLRRLRTINTRNLDHVTVREWIDGNLRHQASRQVVAAFLRVSTYNNAPALQSAGAAIDQFRLGGRGVTYIDDGWGALVDGLRAAAVGAGVQFRTGARVDAVVQSGDRWHVEAAGQATFAADAVILAVSPRQAAPLVHGAARAHLTEWAADAVPVEAACLDIALTSLPNPHGNFALGIDRPLYLSVQSSVARLAPQGQALVSLAKYLEPASGDDPRMVEAELERMLDAVQPGWRERVVFRRFLPSLQVTHAVVSAARGGLAGRPGPGVPGACGLFVAGDWVGHEGMLSDAAVASGRLAGTLAAAAPPAGVRDTMAVAV